MSDAVREAAGRGLVFRFLDVVAVSGKGQTVRVHELLGSEGYAGKHLDRARRYEEVEQLPHEMHMSFLTGARRPGHEGRAAHGTSRGRLLAETRLG